MNFKTNKPSWLMKSCRTVSNDCLIIPERTQQCSYDDGYIYQQIFACKTCYDEKRSILENKDAVQKNEFGDIVEPVI
jgi:hypothetical protein